MSPIGANSGVASAAWQVPSARTVLPVGFPSLETQKGDRRRASNSGTEAFSSSCLSAIDGELSIMNSTSTLSTTEDTIWSTNTLLVVGCAAPTPPLPARPWGLSSVTVSGVPSGVLFGARCVEPEQPKHSNPNAKNPAHLRIFTRYPKSGAASHGESPCVRRQDPKRVTPGCRSRANSPVRSAPRRSPRFPRSPSTQGDQARRMEPKELEEIWG